MQVVVEHSWAGLICTMYFIREGRGWSAKSEWQCSYNYVLELFRSRADQRPME